MRNRKTIMAATLFAAMLIAIPAKSSRLAMIQGKEYKIDTLSHVKIGPGTMHTRLLYRATDGSKKFRAFFIESDMKNNDNVEYRMEIGNDTILTGETISHCAQRKSSETEHYFAGVNADFYYTTEPYVGIPYMACYMNGQIATTDKDQPTCYGHFFMDYDKNMWCDYPLQSLQVGKSDGTSFALARINFDLFDGEVVLMNEKMGHYTHTDASTTEVAVRLMEGESWAVNKKCKVQVVGTPKAGGNMKIEAGGAVLSAKGSGIANISELKDGDELTLDFVTQLQDYGIQPAIKECSGGDVVILKKGEVMYEAGRWINPRDTNNPRTMFGYPEDRSKMIWGLIDGRSSISDGSTYPEGADVMALAGCYEAVNVDGGGSSQMYINGLGMANKPSDGKERAVANGFYAVLKAPTDNEIAEIRFMDWSMQFPKYGVYKPTFYGYNKYGLLIDTDVQGVKLSCNSTLGRVQNDGTTFVGDGEGTEALTATLGGMTATIPVTIVDADNVSVRLEKVLIDGYHSYDVEMQSIVNEQPMAIDPAAFAWSSEDVAVATVDADSGKLQGVADGVTTVHAVKGVFEGEIAVTVEKPTARVMPADKNLDASTWKISQVGGKNMTATPLDNGMKLTYTGASGRGSYIKLAKSLKLWSMPDTLRLRLNIGDAPVKSISLELMDNSGTMSTIVPDITIEANKEMIVDVPTDSWTDAKDFANYPITLNYIYFTMGTSTTGTEYVIDIPGIETVYEAIPAPSGVNGITGDEDGTVVTTVGLDVVLSRNADAIKLYNTAGQEMAATSGTATITAPCKGIYILNATIGSRNIVRKVVVK